MTCKNCALWDREHAAQLIGFRVAQCLWQPPPMPASVPAGRGPKVGMTGQQEGNDCPQFIHIEVKP